MTGQKFPRGAAEHSERSTLHSRLKVQHLVTLISIGQHRNAHRAAQEMGLSQPAISKIIREVEQIFGTVMFERGRGGMIPNRVGEALIARARSLVNDIDRTRDEIDAIVAGHIGSMRIGAIAFLAPEMITQSINLLAEEGISISVEVHEGTTSPLVSQLLSKELDCIIGRYSFEHEAELDQKLLAQQHFAAVISSRHTGLNPDRQISLADAAEFPWIVTPPRTAARQALTDTFVHAGLRVPDIRMETASMEVMRAALTDCNMIGLLPYSLAEQYSRLGLVRVLDLPVGYQPAPVMLIRRRSEPALPSVQRFCDALFKIAPILEAPKKTKAVHT